MVYSSIFKSACPRAYSYAYDASTSTFACKLYDYTIAFCLPTSGIKKSDAMFLGAQIDGQSTGDGKVPPTYSNSGGGAHEPPIYNNSGGRTREPAMTASSASIRYIQPWLLLLLVFFF